MSALPWWIAGSHSATVSVRRGSEELSVAVEDILADDFLFLRAGDDVPADCRLLVGSCRADLSILTGEHEPVLKSSSHGDHGDGYGVQAQDMLPCGAHLVSLGNECGASIEALVIAVGSDTVMAKMCAEAGKTAPVCLNLDSPSSVSLQRLANQASDLGCLIRDHVALGVAGRVTAVVFDKTGVLCSSSMKVETLVNAGKTSDGAVVALQREVSCPAAELNSLSLFHAVALLSAGENPTNKAHEAFVCAVAHSDCQDPNRLRIDCGVRVVLPLNSRNKFEVHASDEDSGTIYVKGAIDVVLARCESVDIEGEDTPVPLSVELRDSFENTLRLLGAQGLRVLAFAKKADQSTELSAEDVQHLTLLGFVAMGMPLAPSASETVHRLQKLGCKIAMATGDTALAAQVAAQRAGISRLGVPATVQVGHEVENWDLMVAAEELVAARSRPEDKLLLVQALQRQGHVVCAVGDGVNDAPMLQGADFGVAMAAGSPVTKSAASMLVLGNDLMVLAELLERSHAIAEDSRSIYDC